MQTRAMCSQLAVQFGKLLLRLFLVVGFTPCFLPCFDGAILVVVVRIVGTALTVEEFAAYVADDLAKWARLAKEAGLKVE